MDRPASNRKPRENQMDKVRGLTGMAMGVIYIAFGIFLIYAHQKHLMDLGSNAVFNYIVAGIAILYGLYRIWRGWKIRKHPRLR